MEEYRRRQREKFLAETAPGAQGTHAAARPQAPGAGQWTTGEHRGHVLGGGPAAPGTAAQILSDEEYARRLQAEEEAAATPPGGPDSSQALSGVPGGIPGGGPLPGPLQELMRSSILSSPEAHAAFLRGRPSASRHAPAVPTHPPPYYMGDDEEEDGSFPGVEPDPVALLLSQVFGGRGGAGPRLSRGTFPGDVPFPFFGGIPAASVPGQFRVADPSQMSYEQLLDLIERMGGNVNRGASSEQISANSSAFEITDGNIASFKEKQCQICLDGFEQGQRVRTLPCFHSYHEQCIDTWLSKNKTCPVCKAAIDQFAEGESNASASGTGSGTAEARPVRPSS